jgi:hypothetical protein
MTNICAHPDCNEEGTFPAPRNVRDIYDRQYFCQPHIKEFNKKWNGLDGMSEDERFAMQTKSTWERPTWKFGIDGMSTKAAGFDLDRAEDLYHFFKQRQRDDLQRRNEKTTQDAQDKTMGTLPDDVKEACIILNVALPMEPNRLKKQYLKLVKKHHPDTQANKTHGEEMIKKINIAYQILKDYTSY